GIKGAKSQLLFKLYSKCLSSSFRKQKEISASCVPLQGCSVEFFAVFGCDWSRSGTNADSKSDEIPACKFHGRYRWNLRGMIEGSCALAGTTAAQPATPLYHLQFCRLISIPLLPKPPPHISFSLPLSLLQQCTAS